MLTFHKLAVLGRLSAGQDGLDKDPDAALGRVPAAHDAEPQRLFAVPLLEDDRVEGAATPARQRAKHVGQLRVGGDGRVGGGNGGAGHLARSPTATAVGTMPRHLGAKKVLPLANVLIRVVFSYRKLT